MLRYANYLIIISMNINENIKIERKSSKKKWGLFTKLLLSQLPLIANFKIWYLIDNYVFSFIWRAIYLIKKACMLIKTLQRKAKIAKKCAPTLFLLSQLVIAIEY